MPTYTVTFRSATRWAEQTIRARTPRAALTKARQTFDADPLSLDWEDYHHDGLEMLEEIVVSDDSDAELAAWLSEDARLCLAADDLLEALALCENALSDLARLDDGTCSVSALHAARAAIAKAKGGAS
jgi:hypothetical protein